MYTRDEIIFQLVFPILGGSLSAWKSLSPLHTVRLAEKAGDIGSFNPIPQSTFFINSVTWCIYALMITNPIIYITNAFCAIVNLTVLFKVFPLCDRRIRKRMLFVLQFGFIFDLILLCLPIFEQSTIQIETVKNIGKWSTLIFNILLYISPLSTIAEIIRDRDARSVHFGYNCAQFSCSAFWTLYGLDLNLIAVWIPNGIGVIVAIILFFLLCIFPSSSQRKSSIVARKSTKITANTLDKSFLQSSKNKGEDRNSLISTYNVEKYTNSYPSADHGIKLRSGSRVSFLLDGNRKTNNIEDEDNRSIDSGEVFPENGASLKVKPTTTPALDEFLDTTINHLESAVKNFRPYIFGEKPNEVLAEEYDQIKEYNASLKEQSHKTAVGGLSQSQNNYILLENSKISVQSNFSNF